MTHQSFLNGVLNRHEKINRIKVQIEQLSDRYARQYCPLTIGTTVPLPEGTKEGYDHFTIEKIIVQILPVQETKQFEIGFVYDGFYSGYEKEPEKGRLRFTPEKKEEHQEIS